MKIVKNIFLIAVGLAASYATTRVSVMNVSGETQVCIDYILGISDPSIHWSDKLCSILLITASFSPLFVSINAIKKNQVTDFMTFLEFLFPAAASGYLFRGVVILIGLIVGGIASLIINSGFTVSSFISSLTWDGIVNFIHIAMGIVAGLFVLLIIGGILSGPDRYEVTIRKK